MPWRTPGDAVALWSKDNTFLLMKHVRGAGNFGAVGPVAPDATQLSIDERMREMLLEGPSGQDGDWQKFLACRTNNSRSSNWPSRKLPFARCFLAGGRRVTHLGNPRNAAQPLTMEAGMPDAKSARNFGQLEDLRGQ